MRALSTCTPTHQKRASNPIADGCEQPCTMWFLGIDSGPLKEQSMFLTPEPTIHSCIAIFKTGTGSARRHRPKASTENVVQAFAGPLTFLLRLAAFMFQDRLAVSVPSVGSTSWELIRDLDSGAGEIAQ